MHCLPSWCLPSWQTTSRAFFSSSHSSCNIYLGVSAHGSLWTYEEHYPWWCMYFMLIVDDFSRKIWVYSLIGKSQAFTKFQEWVFLVENETSMKFQKINTDNGGEFTSQAFHRFSSQRGIARQFTSPNAHQQNGEAERKNRTIQEMARTALAQSDLPLSFWREVVNTAVYIINLSS